MPGGRCPAPHAERPVVQPPSSWTWFASGPRTRGTVRWAERERAARFREQGDAVVRYRRQRRVWLVAATKPKEPHVRRGDAGPAILSKANQSPSFPRLRPKSSSTAALSRRMRSRRETVIRAPRAPSDPRHRGQGALSGIPRIWRCRSSSRREMSQMGILTRWILVLRLTHCGLCEFMVRIQDGL